MKLMNLFAMTCILSIAGAVVAADKKDGTPTSITGKITKIETGKIIVKTTGREAKDTKEVTVPVTDKTVVTLDGNTAKATDLKVNMIVTVTVDNGTETIAAKSPEAPKTETPKKEGDHK